MRAILRCFPWLLVLAILLGGCSGSGGSGSSTGTLRYISDWTNRGRSVTGLSQRVQLFDLNGVLVRSLTMNQDNPASQVLEFVNVPRGTYRLKVELFSQRDLGGVLTGVMESGLAINGSAVFRTAVGTEIDTLRVNPDGLSWPVQESRQFVATGYVDANIAGFVAPGSISWSQLGGHISINQEGIALGVSQGNGSVRATHTPTSTTGAATYSISPINTVTKKWTVLVFMNAANDLYTYSRLNVNQMEQVANNPDVRFVVQWKQAVIPGISPNPTFTGTRRYLVQPDNTSGIASKLLQDMGSNVDMGDADTMREFIDWAKTYYPAERYCLVVWNHGNGWRRRPHPNEPVTRAVSYDDEFGTSIQIWELGQALGDNDFDILAWDASLMQMLEVAYEVKDHAEFVVGSEESPPGEGYPYQEVFKAFRDNPDATTRALTQSFPEAMINEPSYATRKITQSVIETSKLPALATALDTLAGELIANETALSSIITQIRTQAQSYSPTINRVYRDLYHLCTLLEAANSIQSVDNASAAVRAAITDAIVWERSNGNSPNSNGISIDFSPGDTFAGSSADYALLRLAQATQWNEWLATAP